MSCNWLTILLVCPGLRGPGGWPAGIVASSNWPQFFSQRFPAESEFCKGFLNSGGTCGGGDGPILANSFFDSFPAFRSSTLGKRPRALGWSALCRKFAHVQKGFYHRRRVMHLGCRKIWVRILGPVAQGLEGAFQAFPLFHPACSHPVCFGIHHIIGAKRSPKRRNALSPGIWRLNFLAGGPCRTPAASCCRARSATMGP